MLLLLVTQYCTMECKVTDKLRHRKRVLQEVVETERSYVNNLYNCLKVLRHHQFGMHCQSLMPLV
jgi:hypothetical protein